MQISVRPNPGAAALAAAEYVACALSRSIAERGVARFALAGGTSPIPLYRLLTERRDVDWRRVVFVWGDERLVPHTDPASNTRMAEENLLVPLGIDPTQIHRVAVDLAPAAAAAHYAALIGGTPLDVVLLGLGDDGHTASLFPGTDALLAEEPWVIATISPSLPADRVSLSPGALRAAHEVVFFVTGEGKRAAVARVQREISDGNPKLPAARVANARPTIWFLDAAAGGRSDP